MLLATEELTDAEMRYDIKGNDRYALPAVLRGTVYCSPWCGVHCKRSSYDRAVSEAEALAVRLGDGWSAHVHENMGWFWSATKGDSWVSPQTLGSHISGSYDITGYTASVQAGQQFLAAAAEPEDALGFAVQDARTFAERMAHALDALIATGGGDGR